MAWRDHSCEYEHDGSRCRKMGIYTTSTKCDGKERWYCAYHREPGHRGHEYADGRMLQAINEDVASGVQGRGSTKVARETDALVEAEMARLGLSRGAGEAKVDFVARCLALASSRPIGGVPRPLALPHQEREMLLAAGEDPDVGLDIAPEGSSV